MCATAIVRAQQDISLDGEWQLTVNGKEYTVNVPHTYNIIDGLDDYVGDALYSRKLPITSEMRGKKVRLHFDAVYHDATVFINGKKVGEHLNKGFTPFSFDISDALDFDNENKIEVRTSNSYTDCSLPYKRSFDWSNDGGINRSVRLHISGPQSLRYVHVTPSVNLADSTGNAAFHIRLWNERINRLKGHLTVKNRQTGEKVYDSEVTLKKMKGDTYFTHNVNFDTIQLWHFDSPNLYDFTFSIPDNDELRDHFGFRDFRIEGRSFVLNGEPVRLPGIEDMPGSNPAYGMAEPRSYMEKSVTAMKNLNTTITRFHWPQDNYRLTLMDEMGILAQEELPWWQQPWKELTPELRQIARETLKEMIEAHYNHPCIYAWGISNEVWGNQSEIRDLGDFIHNLDPIRLVDVACNQTYKELADNPSLVLDIPTWNEYTGTWHGDRREDLPGRLEKLDSLLINRPLFITEAGLCEPAFTGGDSRRIDDMIYHIKEWQRHPFICGYIYFCLQDYHTQMGEEGVGKWRIRRHGVSHCDLTPKPSYFVLQQLMSPIEIIEVAPDKAKKNENSLAGQYDIDASNRDVKICLQVKNTIPSYVLRNYKLQYEDSAGHLKIINLPDLEPGKKYPVVLGNMNYQFSFDVVRPNGLIVIRY